MLERLTIPLPQTSKPSLYPQKGALRIRTAACTITCPGPPGWHGPRVIKSLFLSFTLTAYPRPATQDLMGLGHLSGLGNKERP